MTSYILTKTLAMPNELYVIRHGQPVVKAGHLFPSKTAGLSALGLTQAYATGISMAEKGIQPTVLLCSPLERTRQTADEIEAGYRSVSGLSIPKVFVDCLQEINIGSRPFVTDVLNVFPVLNKILRFLHIPLQHETIADVKTRIEKQLLSELKNHAGTVVIIGHQVSNACIKSVLTDTPWKLFSTGLNHVGVHHLSYDSETQVWIAKKNPNGQDTFLKSTISRTFL